MSPLEKALKRAIERERKAFEKFRAKYVVPINELRHKLRDSYECTHSDTEELTRDWDDGYGNPRYLRCKLCWKNDYWNSGRWEYP